MRWIDRNDFLKYQPDLILRLQPEDEIFAFSDSHLEEKRAAQFPGDVLKIGAGMCRMLRLRLGKTYADIGLIGIDSINAAGKDDTDSARDTAYLAGDMIRSFSRSCTDTEKRELSVCLDLPKKLREHQDWLRLFLMHLFLADYSFNRYKSASGEIPCSCFLSGADAAAEDSIREALLLAECMNLARDLVNDTADAVSPSCLADYCKKLSVEYGFDVQVFDKEECRSMGMGLFTAVAGGSRYEPKLIVLRWNGSGKNPLCLVGKGITYDSGGLSVKTSFMDLMRFDMNGAAAVIGAICAAARENLPCHVVGVIAACENMINENSYRNGDILRAMNGKTVYIGNTDCEGRLTMADSIAYCVLREDPAEIIDIAGLTGSVSTFLGDCCAAAQSRDSALRKRWDTAAGKSGEHYMWMPHRTVYRKVNESPYADLTNLPSQAPGIGAGMFLNEFAGDCPHIHVDLGAMPFRVSSQKGQAAGATGYGIPTLFYYLREYSKTEA